MTEDLQRMAPHNLAAERGVLGGIFRNPEVLPLVRGILGAESFYHAANQTVFRAMLDLAESRNPVDLVSVHAKLSAAKVLEDAGGHAYLAELWESVPTGANAEYHAAIVREDSATRSLIHTATEILRDAYDRTGPAAELVADAQAKLAEVAIQAVGAKDNVRIIGEVIQEVLDGIDARIAAGTEMTGLPTGYPALDGMLGGLRPGQLVIIGARPSVGKTALGVNIAVNIAAGAMAAKQSALLFSLEMPAVEIGSRVLSMGSGVPMHRFTRGRTLDPADSQSLMDAAFQGVGKIGLYVDDAATVNANQMLHITRRAVRRHKVAVALVDYLQLIRPENAKENRVQQVGQIARRLKEMARECGIPVVCMCQLNREVENRPDQKPRLSDLRESGEIEQHADVVILLHRPPGQDEQAECWNIEAIIGKQRNGPTGTVPMNYRRGVMRFETSAA